MSINKLPTAEQTLRKFNSHEHYSDWRTLVAMREFAKKHVREALKAALEEIPYGSSTDTICYEDVKDILTCYPETNIE